MTDSNLFIGSGVMRIKGRIAVSLIVVGSILTGALAAGSRRVNEYYTIRTDQIVGGGDRRQSTSYLVQDTVASIQPVGVTRSARYENRGGIAYALADPRRGDLHENGILDWRDLFEFLPSWQTRPGDPSYRYEADLIRAPDDRKVDQTDLHELMRLYQNR